MKRLGFALALFTLGTSLPAVEAPTEEACAPKACRPLFSTSAGLTEPGTLEMEFGAQRIRNRDRSEDKLFPVQFNLGVCEWFDIRLGWSGPMLRKDSQGEVRNGGGDPILGAQALVLRQEICALDLGLAYWHKVPRASVAKGMGTGRHDDTLVVTASRTSGRWGFDMNAGANWVGRTGGSGRVRQGAVSMAVTCAVRPCWNLTLDTYALAGTKLGPLAVSSILSLSRDISPHLCVDLGIETGLSPGAPRMSLNAGLVWRLGRLWKAK